MVLDSAEEGKESGSIGEEQMQWLKKVLEKPYGNGTIITFHHPVTWNIPQLAMPVEDAFADILSAGDVIGIFCGHTHSNLICTWRGVPRYYRGFYYFWNGNGPGKFPFRGKVRYEHTYHIDGKQVSAHVEPFYDRLPIMAEIPVEEMMKYIK